MHEHDGSDRRVMERFGATDRRDAWMDEGDSGGAAGRYSTASSGFCARAHDEWICPSDTRRTGTTIDGPATNPFGDGHVAKRSAAALRE